MSARSGVTPTNPSPDALTSLKRALENFIAELATRPPNQGTAAFFDFDSTFNRSDAESLVRELKVSYSKMRELNPDLIVELHRLMRQSKEHGRLRYSDLPLFLGWIEKRAGPSWETGFLIDRSILSSTLDDLDEIRDLQTPPLSLSHTDEANDNVTTLLQVFSIVKVRLQETRDFLVNQAKEIREQHGGIDDHLSINELMTKIGGTVDQSTLELLVEQACATHAEQLVNSHSMGTEFFDELIDVMDRVLQNPRLNEATG